MTPPAESELKITVAQIEHGITQKFHLLDEKNKEYTALVEKRAQAERDWRIVYHEKLISLSSDPVTVRQDLVKGDPEVARLKMKYEILIGIEKACFESIKDIREKISVYRSLLSYHKSEKFMGVS